MELTELEKNTLEVFTGDRGAFEIVYKIAKESLEKKRDVLVRAILAKKELTNEEVGAQLRALEEGISLVDGIFREIGQHKQKIVRREGNPAR